MKEDWAFRLKDRLSGLTERVDDQVKAAVLKKTAIRTVLAWMIPSVAAMAAAAATALVILTERSTNTPVPAGSRPDTVAEALREPGPEEPLIDTPEMISNDVNDMPSNDVRNTHRRMAQAPLPNTQPVETPEGPSVVQALESKTEESRATLSETAPDAVTTVTGITTETALTDKLPSTASQATQDSIGKAWEHQREEPVRRVRISSSLFAQVAPTGSRMGSSPSENNETPADLNPGDNPVDTDMDEPPSPPDEDGNAPHPISKPLRKNAPQPHQDVSQRHLFPFQTGLRLSVDVGKGVSLESGLTYMLFISKDMPGTQRLHYLGMPLRVNYTFLDKSRFNLYASAGGQALKCIAGNGPDKPWLFSAEAAIGAGYAVAPFLHLYAEPGFARYFHTGTTEHYYTVNPWAFTLSVGLRFEITDSRSSRGR